jgi:hypothetical protein
MLILPDRVFAPARITQSYEDPNSNNRDKNAWPRSEHSMDYGLFGRIDGYYEAAKWVPAGLRSVLFEYDGSFFKGPNGAFRAWHDGSTFDLQFKGERTLACPAGTGPRCSRISVPFGKGLWEYYDVIQYGRCLAETEASTGARVFNLRRGRIATTLAHMDRAAYNTLRAVCGV